MSIIKNKTHDNICGIVITNPVLMYVRHYKIILQM